MEFSLILPPYFSKFFSEFQSMKKQTEVELNLYLGV